MFVKELTCYKICQRRDLLKKLIKRSTLKNDKKVSTSNNYNEKISDDMEMPINIPVESLLGKLRSTICGVY